MAPESGRHGSDARRTRRERGGSHRAIAAANRSLELPAAFAGKVVDAENWECHGIELVPARSASSTLKQTVLNQSFRGNVVGAILDRRQRKMQSWRPQGKP